MKAYSLAKLMCDQAKLPGVVTITRSPLGTFPAVLIIEVTCVGFLGGPDGKFFEALIVGASDSARSEAIQRLKKQIDEWTLDQYRVYWQAEAHKRGLL